MNYLELKKFRIKLGFYIVGLVLLNLNISSKEQDIFPQSPKLTVVIVVDQLSYNSLLALKPYLTGGLATIVNNGTNYLGAFFPHSAPGTAIGHTAITTGAYAKDHGIVNNEWYEGIDNKKVKSDEDRSENAALFKQDGITTFDTKKKSGKSAKNMMVDNLSDQIVLSQAPYQKYNILSLSIKSRAAIAMAGHLGVQAGEWGAKAIWMDEKAGYFTSSKVYFDKLPDWLVDFNSKQKIDKIKSFKWNSLYDKNSEKYKFGQANNYKFTTIGHSIIGKSIGIDKKSKDPYALFLSTPMANKILIELAQLALDKTAKPDSKTEKTLMWLSLSSLDKIGHLYGPQALEYLDMIYQMDNQLQEFMDYVYKKYSKKDVLFVLTADHGVHPILELTNSQGYLAAKRVDEKQLINNINKSIEQKFNISNILSNFKPPCFYLNQKIFNNLEDKQKAQIYKEIKNMLLLQPGIKRVWSQKELINSVFQLDDAGVYYKNQIYPGRSGQIIYEVRPYNYLDDLPTGTSHLTTQNYDRHVPLVFYQPDRYEKRHIYKNVSMLSLSVSLANILRVPRPSMAYSSPLSNLETSK